MRVLVDVGHPAQVHFFKNVIGLLERRGDEVLVTARDKDVTTQLLDALGIRHLCLGRKRTGLVGMGREYLVRIVRMLASTRNFAPDVMLALTGVTIGPVGALLGVPRIVLEEAEHAHLQRALGLPFATRILTGNGYLCDHGRRQVRFEGTWVQAYLDEQYFQPDVELVRRAGINPDEPCIVLRTVSWSAAHDLGGSRASTNDLADTIEMLSRFGRVLISSEEPLPPELKMFENPMPAQYMHHLLAVASMVIGDGGTMAAEAAVLGTPTVYCSPLRCGYLQELADRYELIRMADSLTEGAQAAAQLLQDDTLPEQWRRRHARLPACEDIPARVLEVIGQVTHTRPTAAIVRDTQRVPRTEELRRDYAWSSITLSTTNVGNHLIEWCLRRALKLGQPTLTFDSFKRLEGATVERVNRECGFVVSPGCTVFEPGQNRAYLDFDAFRVPTPCFGGCFWPAKRSASSAALDLLKPVLTRQVDRKLDPKRLNGVSEERLAGVRKLSQPIGSRDVYTFEALRRAGCDARLVGCPTLMSPTEVTNWRRTDRKQIVMSLSRQNLVAQCKLIARLRRSHRVKVLIHESYERAALRLVGGVEVVTFTSSEAFLSLYEDADLVVTGRLHGALPAIAHGTPVLFYGDRTDTRFSLLEHLGIAVHELSPELAHAATRTELTTPDGVTFERLHELRGAFIQYARDYGIETRLEV